MSTHLKIAILGSRGIPNRYGGFEQLAQHLSEGLVKLGYSVTVYSSHKHTYKEKKWNDVDIVHCYDAEHLLGAAGQFVYDLNCIRDAKKRKFDVLLFLGYTSNSIWHHFFDKQAVIFSNMDGMEWKRTKYSKPVQRFLQYAERLAVKHSDFLIADAKGIQDYLQKRYNRSSACIAYGAKVMDTENETVLNEYGINKNDYYMLMARMEPENNIETVLDGFSKTAVAVKFVVVGNIANRFGRYLQKKYSKDARILFIGAVYDQIRLHSLKCYCRSYFHGHSVGGTNPSLLEAMASKTFIVVHDNEFNKAIVGNDGYYFTTSEDIGLFIENEAAIDKTAMIENNFTKIKAQFEWSNIIAQYASFINQSYITRRCSNS